MFAAVYGVSNEDTLLTRFFRWIEWILIASLAFGQNLTVCVVHIQNLAQVKVKDLLLIKARELLNARNRGGNAHQRAVERSKVESTVSALPNTAKESSQELKMPKPRNDLIVNILVAAVTLVASNLFNWTQLWEHFREPLQVSVSVILQAPSGRTGLYYDGAVVYGLRLETREDEVPQFASPIATVLKVRLRNRSSLPIRLTGYSLSVVTPGGEVGIDPLSGIPGINGRVFIREGSDKISFVDLKSQGFDWKAYNSEIAPHSEIEGMMFFKDVYPSGAAEFIFKFSDTDSKTHTLKCSAPKGFDNSVHGYSYNGLSLGYRGSEDMSPNLKMYFDEHPSK